MPTASDATFANHQFIAGCIREHHAMQCYVGETELFLLPISLSETEVIAVLIDTGFGEKARKRTIQLKSITEPRLQEMQIRQLDLDRIRVAVKHSYPLDVTYRDEAGREVEETIRCPLREEDDFLVGEKARIRMQWI